MIYISLFLLCFDEIHLIGFYFVTWCFCINSYKNTRGFSLTPTAPDEGPSLETSTFPCIVSGSERTFTFRVLFHPLSLVFTSDINISKITKDKFSSEFYEDKAERIFFWICFCSAIAYARSLMLVLMLMLTLIRMLQWIYLFCPVFYLVLMLMSLLKTRL